MAVGRQAHDEIIEAVHPLRPLGPLHPVNHRNLMTNVFTRMNAALGKTR